MIKNAQRDSSFRIGCANTFSFSFLDFETNFPYSIFRIGIFMSRFLKLESIYPAFKDGQRDSSFSFLDFETNFLRNIFRIGIFVHQIFVLKLGSCIQRYV